jgi:hypothetical protein
MQKEFSQLDALVKSYNRSNWAIQISRQDKNADSSEQPTLGSMKAYQTDLE